MIKDSLRKSPGARTWMVAALFALIAQSAAAEWILGAGFSDYSRSISDDSALVSLDYHHRPFHSATRFEAGWGAALSTQTTGDIFLGAGLYGTFAMNDRWFLQGSVMPGAYFEHDKVNDLGSTFMIRSLLGVGYRFETGNALSLALTHKSNASTAPLNPGVNSILLRWHSRF